MKQDCDNLTIDMYEEVITLDNQTTQKGTEMNVMQMVEALNSPPLKTTYYRFYVKAHDGLTTEWTGLSRKQARDMYAYTDAHQPSNVVAYGWEESK